MSKGIAIRTILYLLLGVIVVGILVYMVYTYTGGAQLDEQQCRSRVITWCTGCSVAGWADGTGTLAAGSDVGQCIEDYFATGWNDGLAECDQNSAGDSTETFCDAFI